MTGKTDLQVISYRGEPWLVRAHYPRPHAANELKASYLCPLYDNERDLDGGRFSNHSGDGWLDHCSVVNFSQIDEEGERVLQLEIMLEWIAREGGEWRLIAPHQEDLILEFWFAEPLAANSFDIMYGGFPRRIERV